MRIENGVLMYVSKEDIPENGTFLVPTGITEIADKVFFGCKLLKEIYLPKTIKKINDFAFYNCLFLEKIHICGGLISIGSYAFWGCKLLKEIYFPKTLKKIDNFAFYNCIFLEKIHICDGLISIGNSAFCGCESLIEINLPESVQKISEGAFRDCKSLKEIYIPSKIKTIEYDTFGRCKSLKKIHFPKSLNKICDLSFYECSSLVELCFPENTVLVHEYAFRDCKNLHSIQWAEHHYNVRYIDGHCMHIKKEKYLQDIKISRCSYFPNNEIVYVAEKNGCSAHGKTIRESVADLQFKILQTQDLTEHIQRIAAQGYMDACDYQLLTGACREGTSRFLEAHNLTWDDKMQVQDVLKLTEGRYGFEQFQGVAIQILKQA